MSSRETFPVYRYSIAGRVGVREVYQEMARTWTCPKSVDARGWFEKGLGAISTERDETTWHTTRLAALGSVLRSLQSRLTRLRAQVTRHEATLQRLADAEDGGPT